MNRLKKESTWKHILLTAFLLVVFAELLTFFMITYFGRHTSCYMDMYSDELVGQLIWENKSVFPENWSFGNQYNVISTPVFMALFYGLTGNISTALVMACMTMNFLIVAAFWWALRPFCSNLQISLGLMTLLGCVICNPAVRIIDGHYLYIMANYYACYVIVMLFVWGDWARLLAGKRQKLLSASFLVSLVLTFLIGMQSIRQFLMMILPMAAVELLRLLLLLLTQKGRIHREQWGPSLAVLLLGAVNLLGLYYVNSLDLPHTTIYGSGGIRPVQQWGQTVLPCLRVIAQVTGLTNLLSNDSLPAIVNILGFCLWGTAVAIVLWALGLMLIPIFKRGQLFERPIDLFVLLGFVSFLGVLATKVVIKINVLAVYFFVWYPLLAFSAISVFLWMKGRWKPVLAAVLCVLILNNLVYTYAISFITSLHIDEGRQETSDYVVENGYDYVYGEWFTLTYMAPYGDGQYIGAAWLDEPFQIMDYINITDVYTEDHNQRAIYLVAEPEAQAVEEYLEETGNTLELKFSSHDGYYKLYTSPNQLMHPKPAE